MEIKVLVGNIIKIKADAILLGVFEGEKELSGDIAAVDKALGGTIAGLISQGEIKGKLGEVTVVHSQGKLPAARVVVTGLGKPSELSRDKVCGAVAETCRLLRKNGVRTIVTTAQGAGAAGISLEMAAQAVTEGALLGLYTFRRHITKEAEYGEVGELTIVAKSQAEREGLELGSSRGKMIAEATNLARDMVNEPANYMTPTIMAEEAKKLAESYRLECQVLERAEMEKLGMGALLGVAQGSKEPPKLIVLRYRGGDSAEADLALVGKGITFDSGGISLKPAKSMGEMKYDMAGAASVLGAMRALAGMKAPVNVIALVPTCENMPGGGASKPGDVVTTLSGQTVEILNTDAEGRLILCDALTYAERFQPDAVIDVATLTGACVIALGHVATGLFANDQRLADEIREAGDDAWDRVWPMPLWEDYQEQLRSNFADMANIGGRPAGSVTAASFLARFARKQRWAHLDIAGVAYKSGREKGSTGRPVPLLVRFVMRHAKGRAA